MKANILLSLVTEKKAIKAKVDTKTHKGKADRFKKDLKLLTKNYRMLKADDRDIKNFKAALKLFRKYRENFEEWVYNELLQQNVRKKRNDETSEELDVRSKAWMAIISLGGTDMFPERYDYQLDRSVHDPTELIRVRDKAIRRYQKAFNDAFKAIDVLLKTKGDTFIPQEKIIIVEGVRIVIKPDSDDKIVRNVITIIKKSKQILVQKGFEKLLKSLIVFIDPDEQKGSQLISGEYDPSTDSINMLRYGSIGDDPRTFLHELGHRLWFKFLSERARKQWTEFITKTQVIITEKHIDLYMKDFFDDVDEFSRGRRESRDLLAKSNYDLKTALALRHIIEHTPLYTTDKAKFKEHLMNFVLGEKASMTQLSDYANTDEKEAFAEIYGEWFKRGPREIDSWIRAIFKKIVRAGGFQISESIETKAYILKEVICLS